MTTTRASPALNMALRCECSVRCRPWDATLFPVVSRDVDINLDRPQGRVTRVRRPQEHADLLPVPPGLLGMHYCAPCDTTEWGCGEDQILLGCGSAPGMVPLAQATATPVLGRFGHLDVRLQAGFSILLIRCRLFSER